MSEADVQENNSKLSKREMDETSPQNQMPSKIFYNKKFTAPLKRKRKNEYDPKEEARLERIVFGDPSDILQNLQSDEELSDLEETKRAEIIQNDVSDDSEADDHSVNRFDEVRKEHTKKPAWVDEEDEQFSVQDAAKKSKLKHSDDIPQKLYKDYLHNKYKQIVGTPKWAELKKPNELDELNNEILKHSCHLEKPTIKNLPRNTLDIKALTAINKQTHMEGPIVTSLQFHPSSTVALVAGVSGILSLFQVDGIENSKLHSMQFNKFEISCAKFLREGTEVLVGSQYYAYCYSYNLLSGKTVKIPLPHGITNMKKYEVSPDGKLIAICGRLGEIFLLTSSSKELIGTLKMNAKCRGICFTPDSKTLISHGDSNEMYIWDVNSRVCIHRAVDDGCISSASITLSPNGQFLATGSKEGAVNIYDTETVLQNRVPKPLKIVLNLVTSVTSLKFNPYSEILAMASDKKQNAMKLIHLPSFTVFSNFPTFQANLMKPQAIDFSPASGYLGISNKSHTALLYRLKHYGNY